MNQKSFLIAAVCAVIALSSHVSAGFTAAVTPTFRGGPCSRFAGFEMFTSPYNGANTPDVLGSTAANATIVQTVPGAIIVGTGNIYHMSAPAEFVLVDTGVDDVQQVVLQTSTLGNSRSIATFTLIYVDAQGNDVALPPTEFVPLVQIFQQRDELFFRWDLSNVSEVVTGFRITWSASAANMSFDAALLDVLTQCAPGVARCAGDGTQAACPCNNVGAGGRGCANSADPTGGRLDSLGIPSLANDSLVLAASGMPNGPCLYLQGSEAQNSGLGIVFGDGLLCAGGVIQRLGVRTNAQGASTFPGSGSLSALGQVTSAGTVVMYQVWYRDAASFCTASTFNLTNGYEISWTP